MTAAIFAITNQVEWVIVVAGFSWFVFTPKWYPVEGLQAGTNFMFLIAWAILSVSNPSFIVSLMLLMLHCHRQVYQACSSLQSLLLAAFLMMMLRTELY